MDEPSEPRSTAIAAPHTVAQCLYRIASNPLIDSESPSSVANAERGAILGPSRAAVIEAGGADVGVAEPVLDASDVGLVLEGVGGGGGTQRVDDALHGDGGEGGVLPDEFVDAVACELPAGPAGLRRLEQGCVPIAAVPGELEVIAQGRERGRVNRHGPGLGALAEDPEGYCQLVAAGGAFGRWEIEIAQAAVAALHSLKERSRNSR